MKKIRRIRALLALMLVAAMMLLPIIANVLHAETVGLGEARNAVFRVVQKDESGVVKAFGSGFGIGESAPISYIVTNYHVIAPNLDYVCVWVGNNTEIPCTVVAGDAERDIAVLQLESPVSKEPLPIGTEDMVGIGDDVYALGFPTNDISSSITSYSTDVSVSKGIISKLATWNNIPYYQIDAALNSGNSGGPLLHENGYVIGIATMKMNDAEGISGAIRMEEALDILQSVGVSVKMATLTTGSLEPESVSTASPVPTPTAVSIQTTASISNPPARKTSSTIWLIVFLTASAAFISVLIYVLLVMRKSRSSAEVFPFLRKKESEGYIIGLTGTYAGAVIALNGETIFFGRDAQKCQLVFPPEARTIGRVHCSLRYDKAAEHFRMENYSVNGILLENGEKLGEGDAAELFDGNRFSLVDQDCSFEVRKQAGMTSK